MTTVLTHSIVNVSQTLQNILNTNAVDLGIKAVYYGDQERIPTTPAVVVEPDTKKQQYNGGGVNRSLLVTMTIYIIVYHSFVQSVESNRLGADTLAENIEDLIHENRTLDGSVIECHVEEVASGYATKGNELVRANRIAVNVLTQNRLPS